ncbi:MAG: hypothetical protein F6J93_23230 [Oscillatoria sp. SIO1A7]|nr:hypothetical protein [Oscillatoria sp. SIO1A7]
MEQLRGFDIRQNSKLKTQSSKLKTLQCPMPNAQCPMPNAQYYVCRVGLLFWFCSNCDRPL